MSCLPSAPKAVEELNVLEELEELDELNQLLLACPPSREDELLSKLLLEDELNELDELLDELLDEELLAPSICKRENDPSTTDNASTGNELLEEKLDDELLNELLLACSPSRGEDKLREVDCCPTDCDTGRAQEPVKACGILLVFRFDASSALLDNNAISPRVIKKLNFFTITSIKNYTNFEGHMHRPLINYFILTYSALSTAFFSFFINSLITVFT